MDTHKDDSQWQTMVTIADARVGTRTWIGVGNGRPGDMLVFDQPLLDENNNKIGTNSGFCIRIREETSMQGQWTLSFDDGSGTIQVAGCEFDTGISHISIVGGTGKYAGISGEMSSGSNEELPHTYKQTLRYRL